MRRTLSCRAAPSTRAGPATSRARSPRPAPRRRPPPAARRSAAAASARGRAAPSASTCASKSDGAAAPSDSVWTSMFARHHEIVERHRRQRRGQRPQLVRRRVQPPALVGRADDEHAHVALARGGDRGQVVLEEVVGVQVDVVEAIGADECRRSCASARGWRSRCGGCAPRGETSPPTPSSRRPAASARRSAGVFSPWNDSRSMVSHAQQRERLLEVRLELRRILVRGAAWSAARRRCAGGAPAPCRTGPRWCRSRARSRSG